MTMRACLYSRYSSDLQSASSIEDQVRLCEERAKHEGWEVVNSYSDAGVSGASLIRPGIQMLLSDALSGKFDIVVTEALDRLSRDQADIAGLYKRLEFAGVKIVTLSEGEITSLHIGLKGTMNAMFLRDLADKTRRGLRGRVENGKSGGGISYGYRVPKMFDANGQAIRGEREIDESQAAIVRRIFEDYAHANTSPKSIAATLNREGVPSPSGRGWTQSSINGNRRRGTGVLNNALYIGALVWNRQRFLKDPVSGKRVARLNPESEWVRQSVPELRIIPQELWEAAKARQAALDEKAPGLWRKNRPQYLLSGLLKCGVCGGGYAKINSTHYGCSSAKNKGENVCANRRTIKRETLETLVLSALERRLMRSDLVQVFCEEYTRHMNALHAQQNAARKNLRKELDALAKERENLIRAIKDGIAAALVKDDLERVAARQEELESALARQPEIRPLLHPAMAARFHRAVKDLRAHLSADQTRSEASEHLRGLIEKIVLTPKDGGHGLTVDLHGDLAGILNAALEEKDVKTLETLDRLRLLPANDNSAEAKQDRVGSGGWI